MPPEKLAAMANQIAAFFRAYPTDEAEAGVRKHIVSFWTPAMVSTLRTHAASGATDVDDLVRAALRHRPAPTMIDRAVSPARVAGPAASDAG